MKMMNVVALFLVLTSPSAAGILTPVPEKQEKDVLVKEGHRVVVVEYDNGAGKTKVSISPHDSLAARMADGTSSVQNAKDKLSEKMEDAKTFNPKEMVCDAYGKCKDALAGVIGKTKTVEETAEKAAGDAVGRVKEKVSGAAHKASEKVAEKTRETKDEVKEKIKDAEERAEAAAAGAKQEAKETAKAMKKKGKKELTEIVHQAEQLAADFYVYTVPENKTGLFTAVLNLMGFAAAYGMCIWVTFASSYVLARTLPRLHFAQVQSRIYRVYFKAMAYSVGLSLLGHLTNRESRDKLQTYNLVASLVMIVVNLLVLEPLATKAMLERTRKEKEERHGNAAETAGKVSNSTPEMMKLKGDLRKLNSHSSTLNILTFLSLTWYLVHLGQQLNNATSCSC